LNEIGEGQLGRVVELDATGAVRHRLLDLGIVPGTVVQRLMSSPSGDPVCYRVRGAMIALRKSDCEGICVEPIPASARRAG